MLEDKLLVWRFKRGSSDALRLIYEKYKNDLFSLAIALSHDRSGAEDALHDVFVSFAEFAPRLHLRSSLKSYLLSSVANRVRNMHKALPKRTVPLNDSEFISPASHQPDHLAMSTEQHQQIDCALEQLPYQQREVIILHLQGELKFKQIAQSQGVSINTIQSRYRYGLQKLRASLNGQYKK